LEVPDLPTGCEAVHDPQREDEEGQQDQEIDPLDPSGHHHDRRGEEQKFPLAWQSIIPVVPQL
jgi:hypothetical protein